MALLREREQSVIEKLATNAVYVDPNDATYYRGVLASTRELLNIDFEDAQNG